jgi:hypothetical protein
MSNEKWWAAERKAAEFWGKFRERQKDMHGHNSLNHETGLVPAVRHEEFSTQSFSDKRPEVPGLP